MYRCKMRAYEGTEPYIFISYAHKDSETVLPILDALAEKGYRVWYDDGIAPGSEWPEYIAQHLTGSQVVMAFISPNSIASPNCRREVTFALSKNKRFLGVILEPTQMSAGMEMQLSAQQCVMRYNFTVPGTNEIDNARFFEKLFATEEIQDCRQMTQEDIDAAIAREKAAAEAAAAKLNALKQAEAEKIAARKAAEELEALQREREVQKAKEQAAVRQKKAGAPKEISSVGKTVSKIAKTIGIGIAAVIALVVVLVGLLLWNGRDIQITANKKAAVNASYLTLIGERIDADTVKQINRLGELNGLTFVDCNFDNTDLGSLKRLSKFTNLSFTSCSGIAAYDFLSSAQKLYTLTLSNCGIQNGDLNLTGTEISSLSLSCNSELTVLPTLPGQLRTLDISGTGVEDLSPLPQMTNLKELYMDGCSHIANFEPLTACNLDVLSARDCGISAFNSKFTALSLKELYLDGNSMTDASCFDVLTRLKKVSFCGNPISGADCIVKSAESMVYLNLAYTAVTEAYLNEQVSACTKLTALYLDGVSLDSLDCIKNLASLTDIHAEGCGLTDISALAGKTSLRNLFLADNRISDTSALRGLDSTKSLCIDLHSNAISEAILPEKANIVLLYGNDPKLLSSLSSNSAFSYLAVDYDSYLVSGNISNWFADYRLYVLDVPADQLLNLKEAVKGSILVTPTTEQFQHAYDSDRNLSTMYSWDFN